VTAIRNFLQGERNHLLTLWIVAIDLAKVEAKSRPRTNQTTTRYRSHQTI
jgi:type IV secretory pathway TrbD component